MEPNSPTTAVLKRLYPAVDDPETKLPSRWNQTDKNSYITLSSNLLAVEYSGQGKSAKDAASVRANKPITASCGIYYYEIKVISKGRDGYIGIGLSAKDVNILNRLPGWDKRSYGYHGDDGNSFCCSGQGQPYGPTFTTGDVIGCCINLLDRTCFFTKNGMNLGVAFKDVPNGMYPTIGLQTPGEKIEANFGLSPFAFDIVDYMQGFRQSIQDEISMVELCNPTNDLMHSSLHKIVSSYLVHYGYCSSAETFAAETGQSIDEELESIRNRQRIQKLVLSGKIGEAITTTDQLYPGLLDANPNLLFTLKCRQFVEMVNGSDSEVSPKSVPSHLAPTLRSMNGSSNSSSPYRSAFGSPNSVHSNGTIAHQSHSNGQSNGESVDTFLEEKDLEELSDLDSDEDMEVDVVKMQSYPAQDEQVLLKILTFGKELNTLHTKLTQTQGSNKDNDQLLQTVFSLVAYEDPWSSPVGGQLDPLEREPVCAALNSAILESHNLPQMPLLETILGQTKECLTRMASNEISSCAFASLNDYVPLNKSSE